MTHSFASIGFIPIEVVSFCCSVVKEGVEDCCCVVVTTDVSCCVVVTPDVGCCVVVTSDVSCCVAVTSDVTSVHTDSAVDVEPVVVELWTSGDEALLVSGVIVDGFVDVSLSVISVPYKMYMVISIKIYLLIYTKRPGLQFSPIFSVGLACQQPYLFRKGTVTFLYSFSL